MMDGGGIMPSTCPSICRYVRTCAGILRLAIDWLIKVKYTVSSDYFKCRTKNEQLNWSLNLLFIIRVSFYNNILRLNLQKRFEYAIMLCCSPVSVRQNHVFNRHSWTNRAGFSVFKQNFPYCHAYCWLTGYATVLVAENRSSSSFQKQSLVIDCFLFSQIIYARLMLCSKWLFVHFFVWNAYCSQRRRTK